MREVEVGGEERGRPDWALCRVAGHISIGQRAAHIPPALHVDLEQLSLRANIMPAVGRWGQMSGVGWERAVMDGRGVHFMGASRPVLRHPRHLGSYPFILHPHHAPFFPLSPCITGRLDNGRGATHGGIGGIPPPGSRGTLWVTRKWVSRCPPSDT